MFTTQNTTVFGGRGFSVGGGGGVLKTASGYPLTLTKTVARPPESITICGNTDGVGDWDESYNYFGGLDAVTSGATIDSHTNDALQFTTTEDGIKHISLFVKVIQGNSYIIRGKASDCIIGLYKNSRTSQNRIETNINTPTGYEYTYTATFTGNLLVEYATYSSAKAGKVIKIRDAEVCGCFCIPLTLTDGSTDKMIYLYSYTTLGVDDCLTVNPNTSKATKDDTDISALQDWEQDFTIPKADSLTVSADTEVKPSSMEIRYYGKR